MHPRAVDWSLFLLVTFCLVTGLLSLLSGSPRHAIIFTLHGMGGLGLILLLIWKFRRVTHRLVKPAQWDRATFVSVILSLAVLATIATGLLWTTARLPTGYPSGMNLHILLALTLLPLYLLHMLLRAKPLRRRDVQHRRTAIRGLGVLLTGALAWPLHGALNRALHLPGARRRFTGSYDAGTDTGNAFPVTSWMLDNPAPVERERWQLVIRGAVAREIRLTYEEINCYNDTQRALLDCTGGWYSTQDWQGVRVGRLLDLAEVEAGAVAVSFRSVTGYRWSLPLAEARGALLATRVGGEPLSHGHGAPLRLVAPGRRGFQWVKWVEEMRVLTKPDYGQWAVIFTSGVER